MCTITQWTVHGIHGYIVSMQAHQGAITCCTITQWTVHGIHGYIVSMQANQGAVMYYSEPSMVYMDTLYLLYVGMQTKGLLYYVYHFTQWTIHGIHGYYEWSVYISGHWWHNGY